MIPARDRAPRKCALMVRNALATTLEDVQHGREVSTSFYRVFVAEAKGREGGSREGIYSDFHSEIEAHYAIQAKVPDERAKSTTCHPETCSRNT